MSHKNKHHPKGSNGSKKQWIVSVLAFVLIWGIFFFIYSLSGWIYEWFFTLIPLLLSIIIFILLFNLLKPKHKPEIFSADERPQNINEALSYEEKIIAESELYLDLLGKLTLQIIDYNEDAATHAARLQKSLKKIIIHLKDNPEDAVKVRRCVYNYLPYTVKFLRTYIQIHKENIKGENTSNIISNIEGILYTTANAFENLTDKLYEDDAADISSDINVLEQLLRQEGFLEEDFK